MRCRLPFGRFGNICKSKGYPFLHQQGGFPFLAGKEKDLSGIIFRQPAERVDQPVVVVGQKTVVKQQRHAALGKRNIDCGQPQGQPSIFTTQKSDS